MNPSAIPELLAPAGSPEALRAAVAAGADAVYLGGRHFGARKYAANFSDEELSAAIAYCHARDVRVYVTVNTLVRDDELAAAGAYLCWLHDEGADAVLVQDAGICALAREAVPDLPLHASTQMTVHSAAGVLWAVQQGIRRVVLARECSLGDVERIGSLCRDRHVGLEVFVHGALCYCYSGQCLFSSMIGGRSGNRGTCAQPCRKPYTPVAGSPEDEGNPARMHDIPLAERYLLSPRDLCIYPHLERVASAPVCSLKIEGRMKSAEYVAIVVDIYRRALDAIAGGTWCPSEQDMQKLLFAFNRSFTGGYLMGDRGRSLIGPERPDNRGVYAGTIRSYDPRRNEVVIAIDGVMPEAGDGLAVLSQKKGPEEVGMIVRPPFLIADGTVRVRVPRPVSRGSPVFITRRASLAAEAERIIARGRTRRVPVDLAMSFEENVPCLEGTVAHAGVPVHAAVRADAPWEPARNNPLSANRIRELVGRSGDTPFSVGTFSLSYPGNLFAPVGAVNRLRRELFSALEDALVLSFRPRLKMPASEPCTARFSPPPLPRLRSRRLHAPVLAAYVETPGTLAGAVAGGCGRIYYEPQAGPCGEGESLLPLLENAISRCHAGGAALIWKWPRIAGTAFRRQAAGILKRAMEEGLDGVMVAGGGEALTVRNCCPDLPLFGSAALNVFNYRAVRNYGRLFSGLTLSQELSGEQMRSLVRYARSDRSPALECIVHGAVELMVSEDCLCRTHAGMPDPSRAWTGIRDERGRIFPVTIDAACRTHVFNAVDTCLIDRIPELLAMEFDALAIDLRRRSGDSATVLAASYREAIERTASGDPGIEQILAAAKDRVKKLAAGGITAGHYLQGVPEQG